MSIVQQQGVVEEYASPCDFIKGNVSLLRDGDLVKQAQAGNQAAFETLVERYYIPLRHYIASYFDDYDQRC